MQVQDSEYGTWMITTGSLSNMSTSRPLGLSCLIAMAVLTVPMKTSGTVNIETVLVGNPGNAADTRYAPSGRGSVDYVYNVGKYEVTAGHYTTFLNAVASTDTYNLYNASMWSHERGCKIQRLGSPGNYTYSVASEHANRPVNYVSWSDSVRFANWLHNGQPTGTQDASTTEDGAYDLDSAPTLLEVFRESDWIWAVASESEWYKAAYHKNDGVTGNYHDYPTSSDSAPSNQLIDPDPGNNANFYDINTGHTIGSPYWQTEVGEFENSGSPYGTFDQGGNVWEWNESVYLFTNRGVRGGSYASVEDNLHAAYGTYDNPSTENGNIGFRVVQVPEPTSLFLVSWGMARILRKHTSKCRS
jgi:formylglycine-generating enzyme required for sulfatase activity